MANKDAHLTLEMLTQAVAAARAAQRAFEDKHGKFAGVEISGGKWRAVYEKDGVISYG